MTAFVMRLPGLRAMIQSQARCLGTDQISTLSYALSRLSSLKFVQALIAQLSLAFSPSPYELVALDSMALSLPATRRHQCKKMNRNTVGGGVLWAFFLSPKRRRNPVQILKVLSGAWHDSKIVGEVALLANSVLYLMDRGFYCLENIDRWLRQKVHFIVRARRRSLRWQQVRCCGAPRPVGKVWIEHDVVARLGAEGRRGPRPLVRLVYAKLANGEDLILASGLLTWSAERILEAYRQRWQIEEFHKLMKETVGLAHLYNFRDNGLKFLLHVATLIAILLFLGARAQKGQSVLEILRQALKQLRENAGIFGSWQRNTVSRHRRSGNKKRVSTKPRENR